MVMNVDNELRYLRIICFSRKGMFQNENSGWKFQSWNHPT